MGSLLGLMALFSAVAGIILLRLADARRVGELADGSAVSLASHISRTFNAKISLISTALWGDPQSRIVDLDVFEQDHIQNALRRRYRKRGRIPKRFLDIFLSLILLLFLAPLLIAVAIIIKLDSPGTIFYQQKRVGLNGKVFSVIKFRTMVSDAEKDGARWASKNDDRITRLGRFLRRSRIDEIPQAFNVLSGSMSFVGPRPERPEFIVELEKHIPHYNDRHAVKPGITGWAQVEYTYGASIDDAREKLKYDLYYIKNFSLALDFIILLKTVRVTLFGIGSR